MSERNNIDSLSDISEACRRILLYCRELNYSGFMNDVKTQDAVVRNLEIIGEAVKNIPSEITAKYPFIPWSDFAKLRDKLIHHYFGVNFDIVWGIIEDSLPEFLRQVEEIIKKVDTGT